MFHLQDSTSLIKIGLSKKNFRDSQLLFCLEYGTKAWIKLTRAKLYCMDLVRNISVAGTSPTASDGPSSSRKRLREPEGPFAVTGPPSSLTKTSSETLSPPESKPKLADDSLPSPGKLTLQEPLIALYLITYESL